MTDLILLGDQDGGGFAGTVAAALSRSFSVARLGADVKQPDFFLTELAQLSRSAVGCILLCKNSFHGDIPAEICLPNTVGVLRSDNLMAARALQRCGLPAVSCGMAVTDTLTFSSMTVESVSVCLQRSIPTLDGSAVEPGEMPLALSRAYGDYSLMCAVAALLLSGGWDMLAKAAF